MNISLRQKSLKDGRISLFLDYYLPKAKQIRRKESLKLYLYSNPKSKPQKEHNKNTLILAESIRSRQLLKLQHEEHDFSHLIRDKDTNSKKSFIAYFREQTKKKINNKSSYGIWNSVLHYITKYAGTNGVFIQDIDKQWVEGFKEYLLSKNAPDNNITLSVNTAHIYFSKFKTSIRQAQKDKLLNHNPCEDVAHIQQEEKEREFLTLEELKALVKTECRYPILKKAFLFSALTGLRKSDILKMKWRELQYSKEQGWYIRFTQKKTKGTETLPISTQARDLLGEPNEDKGTLVFNGLKYDGSTSIRIQRWILNAGISKKITFHCARHTFATLQLTFGTDIYTVSKLLGHRVLKTTQIYAKIIDQKKVDAVNSIPNLDI